MSKAAHSSTPAARRRKSGFIETREYGFFAEFCDDVIRYGYIGLCVGWPGTGKTEAAKRYSGWDKIEALFPRYAYTREPPRELARANTVFYTPPVANSPKVIESEIERRRNLLGWLVETARESERRKQRERRGHSKSPENTEPASSLEKSSSQAASFSGPVISPTGRTRADAADRADKVADHVKLLIVDEADWLKVSGLEQLRAIYDKHGMGMVLIGMPGLEKRLARYGQLYSRVGFVHEFRSLGEEEIREIILKQRSKLGVGLSAEALEDEEALATIIRISRGNFRLIRALLQQVERMLEANDLELVTAKVVEAAAENLVMGAE